MAVGLTAPCRLLPISGIELATTAAGIRYGERDDMLLLKIAEGASTAGVFTQNNFCAAPVILARQNLMEARPRAFLINAGNANAGTGAQGLENARQSCEAAARELGCASNQVLPFSTGVIGEQLPMTKITTGIKNLAGAAEKDAWLPAATAIMTTDTVPKGLSEQVEINGLNLSITGIAKGSGMICPDMATMLAYVATDAAIESKVLNVMLERATEASFNRITVDSDTSTNDALMLVATGHSELTEIRSVHEPAAACVLCRTRACNDRSGHCHNKGC